MQLAEISERFEALGLSVVAMTYDSVDTLKEVEEDNGIPFALLHDADRTHVTAFDVLNDVDYRPGQRAWGVPYPGIFLIDADGIVRAKFAEERYQDRPDFANVLAAAADMAN